MPYGLDDFARDLRQATDRAPRETRQVVERGAGNIKDDARRNVSVSAPVHNAHAQNAITYDVTTSGPVIDAEIGYDKSIRGGALGNLLEYGGGGDHSPPHRDLGRAADAEEPRFEQAISDLADRLL